MSQRDYLAPPRRPCRRVRLPVLACAAAAFLADAAQAFAPQNCSTQRVSVASDGTAGTGPSSRASISADGRFVAFESSAPNLVANDTNSVADIFVHDRWLAATQRVSVTTAGGESNQNSRRATVSGNGRFVVFESDATNLVPGDTNLDTDIFVHDRQTGQTTRVSIGPLGSEANSWSALPSVSFDGRYVAFHSYATNLVANDANGQLGDIFVRDRTLGVTEIVSVSSSEVQANFTSQGAAISLDGRFVAFESFATNLVSGIPPPLGKKYIFLRDRTAGTTLLVSVGEEGALPNGTSQSPSVSADGRIVAFQSRASNLGAEDLNGAWDVYVRNMLESTTELITGSAFHSDAGGGDSELPTISPDGRFLAFMSFSATLVEDETDTHADVFVYDRALSTTSKVSLATDGTAADDYSAIAQGAAITSGGRQVVFHGLATNLVTGDDNGSSDVFVQECVESTFVPFCLGTESACPCGNEATAIGGCNNSFSTGGSVLSGSGTPSVGADTVTLTATGLPPFSQALFFQGDVTVAAGLGEPLGDGLRCTEGVLIRLGLRTGGSGSVSLGEFIPGDPSIAFRGGLPAEGGTRHYQALYRDNGAYCTASNVNLSNAITIDWLP